MEHRTNMLFGFEHQGFLTHLCRFDVDYDDEPIILSVVIGDQCPAGLGVKAEAVDEIDIDVT